MELRMIGYWRSYMEETLPNPSSFVVDNWLPDERELVINHLKKGTKMPYGIAGVSWCRFHCDIVANGSLELTDGDYLWPEGLAHYLEFHNLKLPQEFIDNCKEKVHSEPFVINENTKYTVDNSWWLNQMPLNENGPESFIMPLDYDDQFVEKNYTSCMVEFTTNKLEKNDKSKLLKYLAQKTKFTVVDLYKFSKLNEPLLNLSRSEYELLMNSNDALIVENIKLIKYKL